MPSKILSDAELQLLYDKHHGNYAAIGREIGSPRSTVAGWYRARGYLGKGKEVQEVPEIELPDFPEDDIPTKDIIGTMSARFLKRWNWKKSKDWFPVKVNTDKPIGIAFIGDPHLDDNGCNWPMLERHVELLKTEGMYAVNIGDSVNNWVGRLSRLYADQDTSKETARKLVKWFLRESGISWIVWLLGNHDLWGDFDALLREMNTCRIPMEDWQARWKLVFPNGKECKIWTAHDFKGHSMWNTLHGAQKAAHMRSEAHIYACGHTHNWACHQEESASKDFTYWLIRSRGYKYIDDFADLHGHFPQREGASITCIIDPRSESMSGFVQAFADMDRAVDYLKHLRNE